MPEIGFAERFAYIRWLRSRGRLGPETDRELSEAWGVGESWIRKWKSRPDAPEGRTELSAIEAALGLEGARWLYDGKGSAPEPEVWASWLAEWEAVARRAPRLKLKPARGSVAAPRKRA